MRRLNMFRKMLNGGLLMLAVYMSAGCKKFVQIDGAPTQLATSSLFSNNGTATSALINIYQQMRRESFSMAQTTGLLGDELINYSSSEYQVRQYTNDLIANNVFGGFGPWSTAYNYIYQANAIIEGLINNDAIDVVVQQELTGEAKFIRALWYFYLVNGYGDVPLALTTSYMTNSTISRSPVADVYQQIINDLKDAQTLLSENFVGADNISSTNERGRPNKWAATALLARVYLYDKQYQNAETQASAVIANSTLFSLPADLNQVFLANSPEAIWQLAVTMPNGGINTVDGQNFVLQGAPSDASSQPQSISMQLMSAFETGDLRKDNWVGSVISDDQVDTFYYPFKYKIYYADDVSEYTMMLRLAEQYLIRAEARAQQNNIVGAQEDVDVIRQRAGLSSTTANDQASMLTAILHERQVELFTEWGHRWFDMIRMGVINNVMGSPGNVCQLKGGTWSDDNHQLLLPIPYSDMITDPNLTQNPRY